MTHYVRGYTRQSKGRTVRVHGYQQRSPAKQAWGRSKPGRAWRWLSRPKRPPKFVRARQEQAKDRKFWYQEDRKSGMSWRVARRRRQEAKWVGQAELRAGRQKRWPWLP